MLSAITQPNYPKAAIGFEKDSITALALQKEGRGQYGISQAATIDLPANLLTPSFLETNISNPRELSVLIEEALEGSGLLNQKKWEEQHALLETCGDRSRNCLHGRNVIRSERYYPHSRLQPSRRSMARNH